MPSSIHISWEVTPAPIAPEDWPAERGPSRPDSDRANRPGPGLSTVQPNPPLSTYSQVRCASMPPPLLSRMLAIAKASNRYARFPYQCPGRAALARKGARRFASQI
jgi:hypothetical protein